MKVFEKSENGSWGNRLNFIDKNNVVVGYDYESSCCESFSYTVTNKECLHSNIDSAIIVNIDEVNSENLYFDTSYNVDVEDDDREVYRTVFKILGGDTELFLILENCHNGYYSHGFEMTDSDGKELFSGSL